MDLETDFKELLDLFNVHRAEDLVVGAYALAPHGFPPYTGDPDIRVRPTPDNPLRVMKSVEQFGFGETGLKHEDFMKVDAVVQLGAPPVRKDVIPSISGVSRDEADSGRVDGTYGEVPIHFLGRNQVIANKRASERIKDLADLEALGEE